MEKELVNYYSLKEIAEGFSIGRSSVTYWLKQGKLKAQNFGNAKMVRPKDLLKFLEEFPKLGKIKLEFLQKVKADAENISL